MNKKSKYEKHETRLATTDESGHRVFIHLEDVKGFFRTRRLFFFWFLILFYLVLPWINVNGKQSILLDLTKTEFTFFGHTFFGHDAPLLIFIFLGLPITIGFITSIWGRLWCGWACPQTVFIDAIYRNIERWVEGKARDREALEKSPLNFEKILKRSLKWLLYLLASLHIAHSFIGYFVGTRKLFWISLSPPSENMGLFITTMVVTIIIMVDFGWFREQFCIIACPYGRMQSVLMDDHSMVIAYDPKRGEPRRSFDVNRENEGDCINCYHCVKVCPTGIDIRRGNQLECIACTNCIDACDEIMGKLDKPKGLIRYSSQFDLDNSQPSEKKWRLRPYIYLTILICLIGGFIFSLSQQSSLRVVMLRGSKSTFQEIKSKAGSLIVNHYHLTIDYNSKIKKKLYLSLKAKDLQNKIKLVTPKSPWILNYGHNKTNLFFKFEKNILKNGMRKLTFIIRDQENINKAKLIIEQEVTLAGPL